MTTEIQESVKTALYRQFRLLGMDADSIDTLLERGPDIALERLVFMAKESVAPKKEKAASEFVPLTRLKLRVIK